MKTDFNYYIMKESKQHYPVLLVKKDEDKIFLECSKDGPKKPPLSEFITTLYYYTGAVLNGAGGMIFLKKRIMDVLLKQNIEGVKFIPTELKTRENVIIDDYYGVIVENNYKIFINEKKSILELITGFDISMDGEVFTEYLKEDEYQIGINEIVLNMDVLRFIPLNKRLIFELHSEPGCIFFHASLVDIINSIEPVYFKFESIEDWYKYKTYYDNNRCHFA